ncbi:hypothetical protein ABKN59_008759 [Abortiporus biennis]
MTAITHSEDNDMKDSADKVIKIYAGRYFDSLNTEFVEKAIIVVSPDSGLILDVQTYNSDEEINETVDFMDSQTNLDLRQSTVLPGFVDVHVHFFLHPYSETSWEDQVTRESLTERTVRATVHAKQTLMAGFTAVRDLGTEGAEDADIALRGCISGPNPIIPGPRYFCANRAIVPTGGYGPKNRLYPNRNGVEGITGAEVADGVDGCVRAVRRQVGAGADWIKVYADYRFRTMMSDVAPAIAAEAHDTFTMEEINAIIDTSHRLGVKVAAHCNGNRASDFFNGTSGYHTFDSVEHAFSFNLSRKLNIESRPMWVPTLAVYYTTGRDNGRWDEVASNFTRVLKNIESSRDLIACGGDTGPFPHGDNSLELKLMVRLGADYKMVLRWATFGGWVCIRSMRWEGDRGKERISKIGELNEDFRKVGDNEVPFGVIARGFAADLIATDGDLENDFENAVDKSGISFVMKGGKIYKHHGVERV